MIYNIMLDADIQHSGSDISDSLLQILLRYGLLQNTEHISLCCRAGPCWLSGLYIVVRVV